MAMEAHGSTQHSSVPCNGDGTIRCLANYHPTVWGDYFIENYPLLSNLQKSEACIGKRIGELKEEVKNLLKNANDHLQEMELIDALQRLGVAYHFEKEIDEILSQIYHAHIEGEDLHAVALRFRLLRQHGYNISTNIFIKFKEVEGGFNATLRNDVKGLLSLYEAAYLGTLEDDVLDEALNFAKVHLKSMERQMRTPLATRVLDALEVPLHRRMGRLEAKNYISIYQEDESRINVVLELAKLDFHVLQSIHREEVRSISMWWKALGLAKKLTFSRDRVVECYFWILGVYFEPHYSRARIYMTKFIALLSIMDDIYDNYGTVEELQTFTEVIQRWDIEAADQLEEFFKLLFLNLYNTFKEFEDDLAEEGNSYRVDYLKESLKKLSRAYFEEAKWRDEGYEPPLKEYLNVSLISCCYAILSCASFVGMGEEATKEAFDWVTSFPRIIKAISMICRLLDDVVSNEFEQERKHVSSAVQCYVKEHGTSVQEACEKLLGMIEDEWKILNHECLHMAAMPTSLIMRIINLARMMETIYRKYDSYTHALDTMKDHITSLLVEPIAF
ncbi:alpha-humulene synthase-like [Phoenix dactylifera]|uniref:Alpha-humulene synthase-like n=1 Tax=Phoenix dactylifera TaxID=42345 RepID=A0A8B9AJU3_PHODC|nr:alpha-humulene synthase-like [Phoenix dactylifera]